MCVVVVGIDVLYNGPAGSMLSYIIHSLLLLPVRFVRPLLHELLSLLPYLDMLNTVLPAAAVLEAEELNWSVRHGMCPGVLVC